MKDDEDTAIVNKKMNNQQTLCNEMETETMATYQREKYQKIQQTPENQQQANDNNVTTSEECAE